MVPGDAEFDSFAAEHTTALLRLAYLLCRDASRAEDLVQDALEQALKRWRRDGPPEAPPAYVRRIVVNAYLGRGRRRASTEVIGLVERAEPATSDGADERALRALTWQLLDALEPRQRAVLVLRYYVALPDRDIAEIVGCAEPTVRSLAARAFARLREHPQIAEFAPGRAAHTEHNPTEA